MTELAPTDRPLDVAFAIDRGYVPWCATAIASVLRHTWGQRPVVHLLHDESLAGHEELERLRTFVDELGGVLRPHQIPAERLRSLPGVDRFGAIVWARLLLPELLADVARVLYLDADVFACGSVAPLWDLDLSGAPLAAVANVVEPGMRHHVRRLGLDPAGFFNSGVLLLDLDAIRREDVLRAAARCVEDHRDALVWPDQDVLNLIFQGRWRPLEPRWNAQNSLWHLPAQADETFGAAAADEARTGPLLLHFEGPSLAKPWHHLCQHPARFAYLAELAGTPWAGAEPEDRTWGTRLIRRLPRSWWVRAYVRLLGQRGRRRAAAAGAA